MTIDNQLRLSDIWGNNF